MADKIATAGYLRSQQTAEDVQMLKDLDRVIAEQETERRQVGMLREQTPVTPKAPAQGPSAIGTGISAMGASASGGVETILDGLYRLVTAAPIKAAPGKTLSGKESMAEHLAARALGVLPNAKLVVDGLLGLVLSPAVGAGEAMQQWLKNAGPEAEQFPILDGHLARLLRGSLGQPVFRSGITGPELRAAQAEMTLGEFVNTATMLVTAHKGVQLAGKLRRPATSGPSVEAPAVTETAPGAATPEVAAAATAERMAVARAGERAAAPVAAEEAARTASIDRALAAPGEQAARAAQAEQAGVLAQAERAAAADTARAAAETTALEAEQAAQAEAQPPGVARIEGLTERERLRRESVPPLGGQPAPSAAEAAGLPGGRPAPAAEGQAIGAGQPTPAGPLLSAAEIFGQGERAIAADLPKGTDGGIVVRAAFAGLAGCPLLGDSDEDMESCMRTGMMAMGLGAIVSSAAAKKLLKTWRDKGVTAAALAQAVTKRARATRAEQPYQPNYNYVEASAQVRSSMVQINRIVSEETLAQKRGTRTHGETEAAAAGLIQRGEMSTERVLALEPGTALNAEEATAARMLTVAATDRAVQVARRVLADDETVTSSELRQSVAIAGQMNRNTRAIQAESGRALEGMKISAEAAREAVARETRPGESGGAEPAGAGGAGGQAEGAGRREPVLVDPRAVVDMADRIGPGMTDRQVAEIVDRTARAAGREGVGVLVDQVATIPGALLEAMYGAMLSGKALVRNPLGNAVVAPMAAWERTLAAYMPRWGAEPGVMAAEGPAMFLGFWEAMTDQARMIRHLDVEGLRAQAVKAATTDVERVPQFKAETFGVSSANPVGAGLNYMGQAIRVPGAILEIQDGMAKAVASRMQLRVEAIRQASVDGLKGEAADARIAELVADPAKLTEAAIERIVDFRNEQAFTADFEGRLLSAIQRGPSGPWAQLAYRLTAAPFVRAPLRIMEWQLKRTPILALALDSVRADLAAGGPRGQLALARQVTGAIYIGSFAYLALQGLVTGNEPQDPKQAKIWRDAGYQAKSFWTGDRWRSYDGLGPVTYFIAGAADLVKYSRELGDDDYLHLATAYLFSQWDNFDSKSYMQAASQMLDVIKAPGPDERIEKAFDYARKRLASFTPAVLREIESMTDPTRRRVRPSGAYENPLVREFEALKDQYRQAIPGLSDAKDEHGNYLVPAQRHIITGVELTAESFPMNPFMSRTPPSPADPVMDELVRLRGAGLSELSDFLGPGPRAQNMGMTDPALRAPNAVRLTPQERDRLIVLQTQVIKDGEGRNMHANLANTLGLDTYRRASDVRKGEIIRTVFNRYRAAAEDRLRTESPLLDQVLIRAGGERQIRRAEPGRQPELRQRLEEAIREHTRTRTGPERDISGSLAR